MEKFETIGRRIAEIGPKEDVEIGVKLETKII